MRVELGWIPEYWKTNEYSY